MKNLTLILIAAFGLNSCVKKEEEVVVPYTCQDCVEIYKTETTSYWGDTIYSSKIDTIKFTLNIIIFIFIYYHEHLRIFNMWFSISFF